MRRDGTMTVTNIKVERTSIEKAASAPSTSEPTRPVRIKKEKVDEPAVDKAADAKKTSNDVSEQFVLAKFQ